MRSPAKTWENRGNLAFAEFALHCLSSLPLEAQLESDYKPERVRAYYRTLHNTLGPPHWWPARTRFEVIVGAYLTQNTSWTNVEKALRRLRKARILTLTGIRRTPLPELETLIRSSGYFRQKAARLKVFVAFVDARYGGSLGRMLEQPTGKLRQELLKLNGVGPETADSILLYAGQHPVFVVDTYTRRILVRHEIISANATYEEIRILFERSLGGMNPASPVVQPAEELRSSSVKSRKEVIETSRLTHLPSPMSLAKRSLAAQIYNDMHGLIVTVGKHYCLKSTARCERCPLRKFLPRVSGPNASFPNAPQADQVNALQPKERKSLS